MSEASCKIHVVAGAMNFEISGPETFVREAVEMFKDELKGCFESLQGESTPTLEAADKKPGGEPAPAPHVRQQGSLPTFPNVLHVEGMDVKVLKTPNGGSTAKKAINTALIYLWGKRAVGVDSVSFAEIRTICKNHGCLDEGNFSKNMKSAKEWLISDDKMLKLTVPGARHAEELLTELNGADGK